MFMRKPAIVDQTCFKLVGEKSTVSQGGEEDKEKREEEARKGHLRGVEEKDTWLFAGERSWLEGMSFKEPPPGTRFLSE